MFNFSKIVFGLTTLVIIGAFSGCNNKLQERTDLYESAYVKFVTPEIFEAKQILVVEGYNSLECPFKRNLNSHHKNYDGKLLYSDSSKSNKLNQSIQIKAQKPLTLAITLSQISGVNDSSICYFRYHAFTPERDSIYEVRLSQDCSLSVYKVQTNSSSEKYTLQETEKPKC